MFKRILTAIAQIITRTTQPTVATLVPPTQVAGPVSQEPTTPRGNKRSAPTTKQSAQSKPKRKPKVAQPTTAAKSRKPRQKAALQTPGEIGSQSATPALQTQSPAPIQRKRKTVAAKSITVEPKSGKKRPTARQVAMVSQYKQVGSKSKTPASKTRQHAK